MKPKCEKLDLGTDRMSLVAIVLLNEDSRPLCAAVLFGYVLGWWMP